ncbi:hypothetical protein FB451DRAFT_1392568 [Mycena latifolia]|nr:hypothetical protein FB451DRAFT_1392568 [Mycena latifolia]
MAVTSRTDGPKVAVWLALGGCSDHLLNSEAPLRNCSMIACPSRDAHGLLERRRWYTRIPCFFVPTLMGFLHEYVEDDEVSSPVMQERGEEEEFAVRLGCRIDASNGRGKRDPVRRQRRAAGARRTPRCMPCAQDRLRMRGAVCAYGLWCWSFVHRALEPVLHCAGPTGAGGDGAAYATRAHHLGAA